MTILTDTLWMTGGQRHVTRAAGSPPTPRAKSGRHVLLRRTGIVRVARRIQRELETSEVRANADAYKLRIGLLERPKPHQRSRPLFWRYACNCHEFPSRKKTLDELRIGTALLDFRVDSHGTDPGDGNHREPIRVGYAEVNLWYSQGHEWAAAWTSGESPCRWRHLSANGLGEREAQNCPDRYLALARWLVANPAQFSPIVAIQTARCGFAGIAQSGSARGKQAHDATLARGSDGRDDRLRRTRTISLDLLKARIESQRKGFYRIGFSIYKHTALEAKRHHLR